MYAFFLPTEQFATPHIAVQVVCRCTAAPLGKREESEGERGTARAEPDPQPEHTRAQPNAARSAARCTNAKALNWQRRMCASHTNRFATAARCAIQDRLARHSSCPVATSTSNATKFSSRRLSSENKAQHLAPNQPLNPHAVKNGETRMSKSRSCRFPA